MAAGARLSRTIPALPVRDAAAGPVSKDGVDDTDFGTRAFATLDRDGNIVTFVQWVDR
jgi:hypothetical protein